MVALPDKLPKQIVDLCWKVKKEFRPGRANWDVFDDGIKRAESGGYDSKGVLGLFIGLEACEVWRSAADRKQAQSQAKTAKNLSRRKRKQPLYGKLYRSARYMASVASETSLNKIQSLMIYGFMLEQGVERFQDLDWEPLVKGLELIMGSETGEDEEFDLDYDANDANELIMYKEAVVKERQRQFLESIRLRVYRLRLTEQTDANWVRARANCYFRELYAIATKARRVRTLQERTSKR